MGLKGYSTSDCTKHFIKNLILFYINHFLPVQIRCPIRRTDCRILTIRKRTKHSVYFSSLCFRVLGTLLFARGIDLFYVECLLDCSRRKNLRRQLIYGCSNFFFPITFPRTAGLPTGSPHFLAHDRRCRIAQICVSDIVAVNAAKQHRSDERGWLMGGRKTRKDVGWSAAAEAERVGGGGLSDPVRKTNRRHAERWMLLVDAMQCGIKSRDWISRDVPVVLSRLTKVEFKTAVYISRNARRRGWSACDSKQFRQLFALIKRRLECKLSKFHSIKNPQLYPQSSFHLRV